MAQSRIEVLAKKLALAGGGNARPWLRVAFFFLSLAMLVLAFALMGGNPVSLYSAGILIAFAAWSFQRAGYILLLQERSGSRPCGY